MRWYIKAVLTAGVALLIPEAGQAQTDICQTPSPSVPSEARVELARIQAEERSRTEMARSNWVVNLVPVKNTPSTGALQPLCIFNIEVVPHVAAKLVGIRAPRELMPAVEEALRRLDVAPRPARTAELTAYLLVVSESNRPGLMPVPQELQNVASQLKNLIPAGNLYLADTIIARSLENTRLQVSGGTQLGAMVSLRDGTPPTVRLQSLQVQVYNDRGTAGFNTDIDVPVGAYVVVGKATRQGPAAGEPVILVMTAKISE